MSRFVCLSVIVLLAAVAVSSKPQEEVDKEHFKELAEECKTEAGATDEDVEHMMKHEPAESHESKCMHACILKKLEIMNDEGKMSKEHALEMAKVIIKDDAEKEAAATDIVEKCEAIEVPEDHCDAAAAYEECIVDYIHEHGLSLE